MARSRKKQSRWGRRLAGGAILLGAALAAARLNRQNKRRKQSRKLSGAVTVRRSEFGAPHIIASSRDDALFGLGFSVASDRLWQMDMYRRVATGRVSEVVGEDGLSSDRLMRLVGMSRIAHQRVQIMDDDIRGAAEAFAAGVNHRITTGALPIEFRILRYDPEPWTVADSVAVFLLLAWSLSGEIETDIVAERLRRVVGDEWTDAIYLGTSPIARPIVQTLSGAVRGSPEPADPLPIFPNLGRLGASNAWAVSSFRSVTGAPLLANDPHLELHNPSIWYEASIEAPGFSAAGVTMPGIPGIVIGRTRHLAWGVTAAMTPQKFLYREQIDNSGSRIMDDDRWLQLPHHDETILVRDSKPEHLRIRITPRGPLLSDIRKDLDDDVSLYWTGMEGGHELATILRTNAAGTVEDARATVSAFTTPPLNIVIADAADNIGVFSIGKLPLRDRRVGFLAPEEFPPWYVPNEDMPIEINPERGWVAAANNRLVDDSYPYAIHGLWSSGRRFQRIADELESRERHSTGDMRTLQLDIYSVQAVEIVPTLVEILDGIAPPWVLDELSKWDFQMRAEARAPLLFETIFREWTRLALGIRLPENLVESLMFRSGALTAPAIFAERLLRGDLDHWFEEDVSKRQLASEAVENALDWLAARLGPDHDTWTWGSLHQLTLCHPLSNLPGPQRQRLTLGPFPVGGNEDTVSPMAWRSDETFRVSAGPSMRFVADLGRPDRTWLVTPPGVSGSPLSRHYADQVRDYLLGASHKLWPGGSGGRQLTIRPQQ